METRMDGAPGFNNTSSGILQNLFLSLWRQCRAMDLIIKIVGLREQEAADKRCNQGETNDWAGDQAEWAGVGQREALPLRQCQIGGQKEARAADGEPAVAHLRQLGRRLAATLLGGVQRGIGGLDAPTQHVVSLAQCDLQMPKQGRMSPRGGL